MGNPMWVAGGKSPNPDGGKRHRAKTADAIIDRLLSGVFTFPQVKKRIVKLTDAQYIETYIRLLTLKVPKPNPNTLTDEEIEAFNEMMEKKVKENVQAKTG